MYKLISRISGWNSLVETNIKGSLFHMFAFSCTIYLFHHKWLNVFGVLLGSGHIDRSFCGHDHPNYKSHKSLPLWRPYVSCNIDPNTQGSRLINLVYNLTGRLVLIYSVFTGVITQIIAYLYSSFNIVKNTCKLLGAFLLFRIRK